MTPRAASTPAWRRCGSGSPTICAARRRDPTFGSLPFRSVYLLQDEWAAEIANRTMHGILHVGWVSRPDGGYRGQLAILVKTNGLLGRAYMAAIGPFRHLIVYPAMMRRIERVWKRPGSSIRLSYT